MARRSDTPTDVSWTDLSAFERDALAAIDALLRRSDAPVTGVDVGQELQGRGYDSLSHSRLYQNLRRLANRGLVETEYVDGRTKAYRLTEDARAMARRHVRRVAAAHGLDV